MLRPIRTITAPAALIGAITMGAASAEAAPMVMLYDTAPTVRQMAGSGGPLHPDQHNVFQQQPVARVLSASRQAWKVAARGPSTATPGLRGRSVNSMVSLLRDRIRRSGARMVFIDEVGAAFHGTDAANLAAALSILSQQTMPEVPNGQPLNERVHIYVQGVPAPLLRVQEWTATWSALALAGGVWWQTYTSTRSWTEAEWATWSGLVQRNLADHGGDLSRLRWVLRHDANRPIADQLGHALRGAACGPLMNGIGAWRMGPEAVPFAQTYRAIAEGAIGCLAAPSPSEAQASGLQQVTELEAGAPLAQGELLVSAHGASQLPAGAVPHEVPARLQLDLGPDPFSIAARVGADPTTFWASAGASIRLRGAGMDMRWPLTPGQPIDVYVLPTERGVITLTLHIPGAALRGALGGTGVDVLGLLEGSGGARTAALERRLIQSPGSFAMAIPLRNADGGTLLRVDNAPPPQPARVQLLMPARLSGNRVPPRGTRPLAVRVRDGRGQPVGGARVSVRLPGGRSVTIRVGASGTGRLAVARRGGVHTATVVGTTIRTSRRLAGPMPRPTAARPTPAARR